MIAVRGNGIEIGRGDAGSITLQFVGFGDVPDGTVADICIQKTPDSENVLIRKTPTVTNKRAVLAFDTADTKDLRYGVYCWDIRFIYPDGEMFSPFDKPQRFEIRQTLGWG